MQDGRAFANQLEMDISATYQRLGYALGWRLLSSPLEVLNGAEVAFLGINPGGTWDDPAHGRMSMANGSAYVDESWVGAARGQSKLQIQVRALFRMLNQVPEAVLAGNLVPFRSPNWNMLDHRSEAITFGKRLWKPILDRANPKLVVCLGRETFEALVGKHAASSAESVPVGWGNYDANRCQIGDRVFVRLPHLSRFGIMTRAISAKPLKEIFRGFISG